jgi:hypothetical protein
MNTDTQTSGNSRLIVDSLPSEFTSVIADCGAYSCLAFVDSLGTWRYTIGRQVVTANVRGWIPVGGAYLQTAQRD